MGPVFFISISTATLAVELLMDLAQMRVSNVRVDLGSVDRSVAEELLH